MKYLLHKHYYIPQQHLFRRYIIGERNFTKIASDPQWLLILVLEYHLVKIQFLGHWCAEAEHKIVPNVSFLFRASNHFFL